jgi:hypothetical protein
MMTCVWCDEALEPNGPEAACDMHRECHLRAIIGSLAHVEQRCGCYVPGAEETDPPGMSPRAAARAAVKAYLGRKK